MKKLFNYALLAAALLVGVSVNAQTPNADAIEQGLATGKYVIPAGGNVDFVIERGLTLALETSAENPAILDLNGHNLVMNDNSTGAIMVTLTKGALTVVNNVKATGGKVINMQTEILDAKGNLPSYKSAQGTMECFSVQGSTDPAASNYTVLTINPEVTVDAGKGKVGIIIDAVKVFYGSYQSYASKTDYQAGTITTTNVQIGSSSAGVAFGVKVDIWGKVHGEKYGVQVSGNVKPAPGICSYNDQLDTIKSVYPFDKFVNKNYKFNFQFAEGYSKDALTWKADANYPQLNVWETAELWSNPTATTNGNGMYIGGYAQVLIKGYVHGSNGVYIKSGDVDIVDAVIKSDNPNYSEIQGKGSGTEGSGNAIVIESNSSYAGVTEVNVSGDTKVEAESGYAIQEVITTGGESKVDSITINGGTFIGGEDKGAIIISQKTGDNEVVTVTSGSFSDGSANGYINTEGGIITEIKDENGNTIGTVITTDENAPEDDEKIAVTNIDNIDGKDYIYWDSEFTDRAVPNVVIGKTNPETVTIKNFTANAGSITVKEGSTLIIDNPTAKDAKVLLSGTAVITLEPGAKMISKSSLGVETASAANLIIGAQVTAENSKMAQFLYHPSVNVGRHPKATVEYQAKAKGLTTWDRFGFPDYKGMCINQIKFKGPQALSYIYEWNNVINDWKIVSDHSKKIAPFTGLTLTNNSPDGGIVYQFPCEIVGNENASLDLVDGWNSFSNSYTAQTDVKAYLEGILRNYYDDLGAFLYVYKNGKASSDWEVISAYDCRDGLPETAQDLAKLSSMQAFLIQKTSKNTVLGSIDYAESVWYPATNDPDYAPAPTTAPRQMMDMNKVVINLTDAQGENTRLTIREAAEFSADYDNGADVPMYENASRFNFYATTDYDNQVQIATNDIEGQMLTLATKGETSFTMSFSNVLGEKMAIRDNMTGDVIEMAEGVTYNFIANANEVSERFTIIAAAKAPTAIQKAEASAKAAKFIRHDQVILQNNGRLFNVLGAEVK